MAEGVPGKMKIFWGKALEEGENRPEAHQRCVEDGFSLNDAVCRDCGLLQPEAVLRWVRNRLTWFCGVVYG